MSSNSHTNGKPCNTLFGQGGVENPLNTILLLKATGTSEDTTKFNILAEDFSALIEKTVT